MPEPAVCGVAEAMLTDDRIVQAGAIAAKALASTVTEEQRSDYFTVLAATAPAPPGAEQFRMQRVCTRLGMARARLGMARALLRLRLPVADTPRDIFSEADSAASSEEPL